VVLVNPKLFLPFYSTLKVEHLNLAKSYAFNTNVLMPYSIGKFHLHYTPPPHEE
jgi:hypothetical protein